MKEMKVRLTFIEEILGTASNDKELHAEYIASKAPDAISKKEEIEAIGVEGVIEKGKTVFPKDENDNPFIYDYQIKGFFKNAAKAFNYVKKLAAYKTKIDNLIFVNERKILLQIPEGKEMGNCQRPLRAQTPQGERVALANSDSCPEGTVIEFTVMSMVDDLMDNVEMWLDYGKLNGIGQWHNSGKGRFVWEKLDKKGKVIGGNKED
jgi:hypothetical protein|nr:MAG TPA: hypothetical protein [Caudoviricetes sp.]